MQRGRHRSYLSGQHGVGNSALLVFVLVLAAAAVAAWQLHEDKPPPRALNEAGAPPPRPMPAAPQGPLQDTDLSVDRNRPAVRQVRLTGGGLAVNTSWLPSEGLARLALIDPDGKPVSGAGIEHQKGTSYEHLVVDSAKPGLWTIKVSATKLSGRLLEVHLSVDELPARPRAPELKAAARVGPDNTVVLSARGSQSSGASPLVFVWDLGNGKSARGETVSVRYDPGRYVPALIAYPAGDETRAETLTMRVIVYQPQQGPPQLTYVDDKGRPLPPAGP